MKILEDVKMILLFQLIYQLQNARSSFEDSASEVEDAKENESAASSEEQKQFHKHHHVHRSGHRHKKSRSYSHDHDRDHDHYHAYARASINEYDDCACACNKCDPPSDCCKSACNTCPSNPYQQPSRAMTAQSGVVFVAYPYPMMMPNPIVRPAPNHHEIMRAHDATTTQELTTTSTTTSTTISTTTTTTTTTKTESPTDLINSEHDNNMLEQVLKSVVDEYSNIIAKTPDEMHNGNNKYMLTSLRRTKPTWMPKYGIVPISDNIAEKLMSKMSRARVPLRSLQKRVPVYDKSYLRSLGKKII